MANDGIILQPGDAGDVQFDVDLAQGTLICTVRAPMAINRSAAAIPLVDGIETLAKILLASCAAHKQNAAKLANFLATKSAKT